MIECKKCGTKNPKNSKFCNNCGANLVDDSKNSINDFIDSASKKVEKVLETEDNTKKFTKKDIKDNKAMAIISYIGPLAIIPYFNEKESKFVRFHAINGMNLLVLEAALFVINAFLEKIFVAMRYSGGANILDSFYKTTIPWFLSFPIAIITFILISLSIMGIVYASVGKAKDLPIINRIKFFKK